MPLCSRNFKRESWLVGTSFFLLRQAFETNYFHVKNEKLFDTEITTINIYASANRNIATLIEAAALNTRLKRLGKDSDKELANRMINMVNVE